MAQFQIDLKMSVTCMRETSNSTLGFPIYGMLHHKYCYRDLHKLHITPKIRQASLLKGVPNNLKL